jgi:hypothetical protein
MEVKTLPSHKLYLDFCHEVLPQLAACMAFLVNDKLIIYSSSDRAWTVGPSRAAQFISRHLKSVWTAFEMLSHGQKFLSRVN